MYMGELKSKVKRKKTFAEEQRSLFDATKTAGADNPNSGASIAEKINFGGRGEQLKKDRLKRKKQGK